MPNATIEGTTATGFEPVAQEFARLLAAEPDLRGQFCAYLHGQQIADLWGGEGVAPDDLQGVFSCTKGVSATCIALLTERGVLDLDAPVSRYWPEFAGGGKGGVTLRVALSHQAGIPGVEPQLTLAEMMDHGTVAARLAAQVPHWLPGKAHGYHALTMGTIMDELVRRTMGVPIAEFFRTEIGDPRGIDFYIRTPEEAEPRVRLLLPASPPPVPETPEVNPFQVPDSLTGMALNVSARRHERPPLPNIREFRGRGQAGTAGVGSARGLARLYAMCISEVDGFPPLLSRDTLAQVSQVQTAGDDLVLRAPTRYAIVFQKPDERLWFGSHQAFGHDGAGGSIGIADPWHGISYAWIPRRMTTPGGSDPRGLGLAKIVRACAAM